MPFNAASVAGPLGLSSRPEPSSVLAQNGSHLQCCREHDAHCNYNHILQRLPSSRVFPNRKNATETCLAIKDWWFYGPLCAILGVLSSKLFMELGGVNDRINMASEILNAAINWLVSSGKGRV